MGTTFNSELRNLRRAIILAWVINSVILTGALFAALIVFFLPRDLPTEQIPEYLLWFGAGSLAVTVLLLLIVSNSSTGITKVLAGGGMEQQTSGQLFNIVEELSLAAGITPPKVYIMRGSGTANAFAIANKRSAQVIATEELLATINREELTAVMAHEIGHVTAKDCSSMTKVIAMTAVAGIVSELTRNIFFGRNGSRNNNPIVLVLVAVSLVFLILAPLLSKVAEAFMSRTRESQADMLSVKYTRNPEALANALRKISGQPVDQESGRLYRRVGNLAFASPAAFSKTFATHPPIEERIKTLEQVAGVR